MSSLIVGIGCETAQELPAEVLAFSIMRHAGSPLEVVKLHEIGHYGDADRALLKKQRTPFSLQRFLLARLLIERDVDIAIYLDSDMLVLRPIQELVVRFIDAGEDVATVASLPEWRRQPQSSVMVMNRAGAARLSQSFDRYLDASLSYDELLYLKTVGPVSSLPHRWNSLEYLDETTALIHYTDMDTQPWLWDGNPNAGIWYAYLWRYAQTPAGRALLEREISRRHVRPALFEVVDRGPSMSAFSSIAHLRDMLFVPPHRFRRVKYHGLRSALAPLLRAAIGAQFMLSNGQPNVR